MQCFKCFPRYCLFLSKFADTIFYAIVLHNKWRKIKYDVKFAVFFSLIMLTLHVWNSASCLSFKNLASYQFLFAPMIIYNILQSVPKNNLFNSFIFTGEDINELHQVCAVIFYYHLLRRTVINSVMLPFMLKLHFLNCYKFYFIPFILLHKYFRAANCLKIIFNWLHEV